MTVLLLLALLAGWVVGQAIIGSPPAQASFWSSGNALKSTSSPGKHTLQFSHQDFPGQNHGHTGTTRVLDAAASNEQMAAVEQVLLLMMTSSIPGPIYLPALVR